MQIVGEPEKAKSREPLILLGLRLIIQVLLPLGSSGNPVQVQVLSPAPKKNDSKSRSFLSIAKAMVYHHAARVYLITEGVYHQP